LQPIDEEDLKSLRVAIGHVELFNVVLEVESYIAVFIGDVIGADDFFVV
jgi:hypothetical protein